MREGLRYLVATVTVSLAVLCGTAAFNYIVDPYDINQMFRWPGVNATRPEAFTHARMHKALELAGRRPAIAIFGSSRAAVGFSTDCDCLGGMRTQRYNAAVPASNIFECARMFEDAVNLGNLRRAVISLDFFQFNGNYTTKPDFDEDLLCREDDRFYALRMNLRKLRIYIAKDTLMSSLATISRQKRAFNDYLFAADGSEDPRPLERSIVRNGGQHALFRLSEIGYANGGYLPGGRPFTFNARAGVSTMSYLAEMVRIARQRSVDLRLVIAPTHVRDLEEIDALGLWNEVEAWKRELVTVVAESGPGEQVQLWDFSEYSEITEEKVPALGDQSSRMRWYWESSHFKKELGSEILRTVFGSGEKSELMSGFGSRLDPINIEAHLAQIRRNREDYRRANSREVSEIRGIVDQCRTFR